MSDEQLPKKKNVWKQVYEVAKKVILFLAKIIPYLPKEPKK